MDFRPPHRVGWTGETSANIESYTCNWQLNYNTKFNNLFFIHDFFCSRIIFLYCWNNYKIVPEKKLFQNKLDWITHVSRFVELVEIQNIKFRVGEA